MQSEKPRLLITSGEPAGIGPDLIIKLSQLDHQYDLTILADADLLLERANSLSMTVDIIDVSNISDSNFKTQKNSLKVLPIKLRNPCTAGKLDVSNATYVLEMLDIATDECLSGNFNAVITAPIQKSVI
ncbi:MAG TPA: 4-hydroxythreonine-4-phosphate dehydrogenase PdxA, partial [Thiotrichaceae bacterium]|nr:4-hydroxythreonine-4-phosphate dehydrogenase PdxA [Thiotrichaceae bacterium]